MAWFVLARVLFVAAVGYSAYQLQPLIGGAVANVAFGLVLGLLIVAFEIRLKNISVTHMLGALLGGAIGLGAAKTIGAALYWANLGDGRVVFLHSLILLALPYLGLVIGGRKGDWLKPENIIGLFRSSGPRKRFKILDTSVIIDGRIADICETGFMDGTLVIPQFVLKELQLVADSSDSMKRNRGRRGLDILQKIQKMSGVDVMISDMDFPRGPRSRSEADRARPRAAGEDRHQRLQLEQGGAAPRRRGAEHQRAGELAQAGRAAGRDHEGVHPQGRQGVQPGRRLSRRRHDGRGRQRAEDDRPDRSTSSVTSVLQTTAGKMIFGRFIDAALAAQAAPPWRRLCRPRASEPPTGAAADSAVGRRGRKVIRRQAECESSQILRLPLLSTGGAPSSSSSRRSPCTRAVLGTLSLGSSLFEKSGYFAHWCARTWSRLILADHRRPRRVAGLDKLEPGRTYVFVANHQSIYDIPILFWSLPYQLRIIAKQSLGKLSVSRLASAAHGTHARRSPASRSREDLRLGVAADVQRAVADRVSRGHAQPSTAGWRRSRAAASTSRSRPVCRSCRCRSSAAVT